MMAGQKEGNMKVKYNKRTNETGNYANRFFTFGKEYKVLADYRERKSGQIIADNGFVVIDDLGQTNMVFPDQVEIIEDRESCYMFRYV